MESGLKAVGLPLFAPEGYEEAFHCCKKDAGKLYTEWFNRSEECLPSALIHPVKLQESFWPEAVLSTEE